MPNPRGRSCRAEQAPFARHALERMHSAFHEADAGTGDEVLDRAGNENLARLRVCRDACPDIDRDAADVVAELDLSGVQAGTDLDAELAHAVADAGSATDS